MKKNIIGILLVGMLLYAPSAQPLAATAVAAAGSAITKLSGAVSAVLAGAKGVVGGAVKGTIIGQLVKVGTKAVEGIKTMIGAFKEVDHSIGNLTSRTMYVAMDFECPSKDKHKTIDPGHYVTVTVKKGCQPKKITLHDTESFDKDILAPGDINYDPKKTENGMSIIIEYAKDEAGNILTDSYQVSAFTIADKIEDVQVIEPTSVSAKWDIPK